MNAYVYLFRHGQAASGGLMTGGRDVPLSEQGEAEIRFWQKSLSNLFFDQAFSSPLLRARQTARMLLEAHPLSARELRIVPDLREVSLGEWEGKSTIEVKRDYADIWEARGRDIIHVSPPGGESMRDLADRVLPTFRAVLSGAVPGKNMLIAAHQAVNRVLLADIEGLALDRVLSIPQPTGVLNLLEVDGKGRVRLLEQRLPTP